MLTLSGFTFSGWNTEPDGSGANYLVNIAGNIASQDKTNTTTTYARCVDGPD
jgi:hypothetical protein